jgi:hypothetical protein
MKVRYRESWSYQRQQAWRWPSSFISVFTRARKWILCWTQRQGHPVFQTRILYEFFMSIMRRIRWKTCIFGISAGKEAVVACLKADLLFPAFGCKDRGRPRKISPILRAGFWVQVRHNASVQMLDDCILLGLFNCAFSIAWALGWKNGKFWLSTPEGHDLDAFWVCERNSENTARFKIEIRTADFF